MPQNIVVRLRQLMPMLKVFFNLPNCVTHLRIALIFLLTPFIKSGDESAIWIYGFALATDLIDGKLAWFLKQQTAFGKIWDPFADKALHLSVFYLFTRKYETADLPFVTVLVLALFLVALPGWAMFVHIFFKKPLRPLGSNPAGKFKLGAEAAAIVALFNGNVTLAKDILWFGAIPLAGVSIALHIVLKREVSLIRLLADRVGFTAAWKKRRSRT